MDESNYRSYRIPRESCTGMDGYIIIQIPAQYTNASVMKK
jgi:hypothetical protein